MDAPIIITPRPSALIARRAVRLSKRFSRFADFRVDSSPARAVSRALDAAPKIVAGFRSPRLTYNTTSL